MNQNVEPVDMVALAKRLCSSCVPGRDFSEMPKKITKAVINSDDTLGLYQYQFTGHKGLELDCYLEYEAEHDGGTGPGSEESWPESITLFYALHKGEDISEVLSDDVRSTIETEALADMNKQAKEDSDDARIYVYIDRVEAA